MKARFRVWKNLEEAGHLELMLQPAVRPFVADDEPESDLEE